LVGFRVRLQISNGLQDSSRLSIKLNFPEAWGTDKLGVISQEQTKLLQGELQVAITAGMQPFRRLTHDWH
jgi:hypothetical protein